MDKFDSIKKIGVSEVDDAVRNKILILTDNQKKILKEDMANISTKEGLFRRLLNFLKPNSEYDTLLIVERTKTIIQIEVKSFTIKQDQNQEKSQETLQERYNSAMNQLSKGKEMFEKISQLLAISSNPWTHVGLVCFPYIETREKLNTLLELSSEDLKVKAFHKSIKLIF